MTLIKTQAIQTALKGDWNSAIGFNRELLKENPNDIDTLNRLAFALAALGKVKDARDTYKKVLNLDSKNPIAIKNLKRLNGSSITTLHLPAADFGTLFIEESGKTKILDLVNVASTKVITALRVGEPLVLLIKRLKIFVLDSQKHYVGMLPDDIAKRLIRFLRGGNRYDAYVKGVEDKKVTIFIKETNRSSVFKNQPSFLSHGKTKMLIQSQRMKDYDLEEDSSEEKEES